MFEAERRIVAQRLRNLRVVRRRHRQCQFAIGRMQVGGRFTQAGSQTLRENFDSHLVRSKKSYWPFTLSTARLARRAGSGFAPR